MACSVRRCRNFGGAGRDGRRPRPNSRPAFFPAQEYVPLRSDSYLSGIAALLNAAPFGVVFNAYDPIQGVGALFGNAAAGPLWGDEALRPITAEAVAAALWLSL